MNESKTSTIPQKYGAWKLQRIADERRMSLAALAESLCITRQALNNMKRRDGFMWNRTVIDICNYLNISINEFTADLPQWQNFYSKKMKTSCMINDVPFGIADLLNDPDVKKYLAGVAKTKYNFSDDRCEKILKYKAVEGVEPLRVKKIPSISG